MFKFDIGSDPSVANSDKMSKQQPAHVAPSACMKKTQIVGLFMEQISLATKDGIKGKDDCLDTISMLQYMNPWKPDPNGNVAPSVQKPVTPNSPFEQSSFDEPFHEEDIDSYII